MTHIPEFYTTHRGQRCPHCREVILSDQKDAWNGQVGAHCTHCNQTIDLSYQVVMPGGKGDWRPYFEQAHHVACARCRKIFWAGAPPIHPDERDGIATWRRNWAVTFNTSKDEHWDPYCDNCKGRVIEDNRRTKAEQLAAQKQLWRSQKRCDECGETLGLLDKLLGRKQCARHR